MTRVHLACICPLLASVLFRAWISLLPAIVEAPGFLAVEDVDGSEWFLAYDVRSGLAEALVRSTGSFLLSLLSYP